MCIRDRNILSLILFLSVEQINNWWVYNTCIQYFLFVGDFSSNYPLFRELSNKQSNYILLTGKSMSCQITQSAPIRRFATPSNERITSCNKILFPIFQKLPHFDRCELSVNHVLCLLQHGRMWSVVYTTDNTGTRSYDVYWQSAAFENSFWTRIYDHNKIAFSSW